MLLVIRNLLLIKLLWKNVIYNESNKKYFEYVNCKYKCNKSINYIITYFIWKK